MNFSCTNQEACPVILDSKCVIYEGENLLYIGVNTNDNYRTALENINTVIGNLILTGGITELTGDVVAVGPGVATATLATVNSTPGQYGSSTAIPKLTVDGKGRITAITTEAVFIPSGALSFIGDVTGTGNTGSDTTLTLKTVNSNVYTSNNFLKFAVNGKGLVTSATAVGSSDIITALGYTPYNASNPAGYISTINGIVAGGELAGTYPNPTLVNAAVTAKVLTGVNITGGSISASDSILTAFGKVQNQINGLIGGSIYQGTWNAATNTPALASGVGTKGYYYIVNVPGSTNLDGITDWNLGDWAIFDGTAWQQVDNTDAVVSVNGFTGAVSLTTDNISEGAANLYFLDSRARLALGLTTTGSTGPATYDNITGVFNIPDYSTALSGYVPVGRTLTINGTTYDLSANRSWTIAGGMPAGGTAGQILAKIDSTDYNTEWIDNYSTQVKNDVKLGAALAKGTPVYVSSADGTNMIVSAASNTSEATSSKTFGLLETGGALNAQVRVVTYGLLAGLDTSAANAEGDPVWLGPGGTLLYGLINKPYAPSHLVYIGVVTRKQSNNGEIFINVQNGFEMDELHNVSARNPANNDILAYNTSTSLWEKNTIAGVLGYTPLSGSGTPNYIPKWSTSTGLTDSIVTTDSVGMTIGGNASTNWKELNIISGDDSVYLIMAAYQQSTYLQDRASYEKYLDGYVTYDKVYFRNQTFSITAWADTTENNIAYRGAVEMWIPSSGTNGYYAIYNYSNTSNALFKLFSGTGNLVIGRNTDNTFAKFQVQGAINQTSVTSSILKTDTNGTLVAATAGTDYVPPSRTLTINGVSYDLTADRSWTIAGGVTSFNTRTGAITLVSSDVTSALGYTPVTNARTLTINGTSYDLSADRSWTIVASATQLTSPNGASVVAADSAMPNAGQSFIHTLALGPSGNDGHILGMTWANTTTVYGAQLWLDTDPTRRLAVRGRDSAGNWTGWWEILTEGNRSTYIDTLYYSGSSRLYTGSDGTRNTGWAYHMDNGTGLHWPNNGWHIYPKNASDMYWRSGASDSSIAFLRNGSQGNYVHNASDNAIGFLSSGRSWILRVDNSGNTTATGDVTAYSDIRLKENIIPLTNALEKVLKLQGVLYNRIDTEDKSTKIGFIAQHVKEVVPEVVHINEDTLAKLKDRHSIDYGKLTALLTEAVKEQQVKIDNQDKIIEELKSIINGFTK